MLVQNVPKKKSRAILITDPETGKPIDMDEDTPRSRQQSESQKSDKGSSEVAIEKVRGMHYYVITLREPLIFYENSQK